MTSETAVFDAGPLIAFHQVGRLELLRGIFDHAVIPPAVAQEVAPSIGEVPDWVEVRTVSALPPSTRGLGPGERAAIALAIQWSADVVVLDDLDARSAAIELGLAIIGSLGLCQGEATRVDRRGATSDGRDDLAWVLCRQAASATDS